jgi:hypothetical protein
MRKVALALALVFASRGAAAADTAASEAAFREARKALQSGNLAVACPLFEKSLSLDPSVGAALNLGDCEEKAGRLADAVTHYRQAMDLMAPADDRRPLAAARVQAHEPRVPRLSVRLARTAPPGVRIHRNGVELDRTALGTPQPVNPGTYAILVEADGRATKRYDVTLIERQTVDVEVDAGPPLSPSPGESATRPAPTPAPSPAATARTSPPANESPRRSSPSRAPAYVALGLGGAGLVTGAVAGIIALGAASTTHDHCPTGVCPSQADVDTAERAKTMSVVSTVGFGVGLAATAFGVYLLVKAGPVTATPTVGNGSSGLLLRTVFP